MRRTFHPLAGLFAVIGFCLLAPVSLARAAPFECTLVVDLASGDVLRRDGICDRRITPMSTFKIPLALIGFETGILEGPHDPLWRYRKEFGGPKRTRKPVDPTIWEAESVLWYSQEITRKLGMPALRRHVDSLDYGNEDVSGLPGGEDALTHAWLASSLAISADEQARFVRRMLRGELPVGGNALRQTRAIIPVYRAGDLTVHGKTGSGRLRGADGRLDRSRPVGWFVGWVDGGDRTLVFALLRIGDAPSGDPLGLLVRDEFLEHARDILPSSRK